MSEHIDCECDSCATVPRAWLVARVEQLQREIDDRAMRIVEMVAAEGLRGVSAGASSYILAILARGIMRDAIDEREAQRVKREGTEE